MADATRVLDIILRVVEKGTGSVKKVSSDLVTLTTTAKGSEAAFRSMNNAASGIESIALKIGAALGGLGAGKWLFNLSAQFQAFEAQLGQMYGSLDKGKEVFKSIQKFAQDTPFDVEGIMKSWIQLKAYGLEPNLEMMRDLGDAVAALGGGPDTFEGIVRALGQMRAMGRVAQQELNQLASYGINAGEILRKEFNILGSVTEGLSQKGITAQQAIEAILKGMREKYGGQMAAMAERLGGLFANLSDSVKNFFYAVMQRGPIDLITNAMKGMVNEIARLQTSGDLDRYADKLGAAISTIIRVVKEAIPNIIEFGQSLYGLATDVVLPVLKALQSLANFIGISTSDIILYFVAWKTGAVVFRALSGPLGSILKTFQALDIVLKTMLIGQVTQAPAAFTAAIQGAKGLELAYQGMANTISRMAIFESMSAGTAALIGRVGALIGVLGSLAIVIGSVIALWKFLGIVKEHEEITKEIGKSAEGYKYWMEYYGKYKDTVIKGEAEIRRTRAEDLPDYKSDLEKRKQYWQNYVNSLIAQGRPDESAMLGFGEMGGSVEEAERATREYDAALKNATDQLVDTKAELMRVEKAQKSQSLATMEATARAKGLGVSMDQVTEAAKEQKIGIAAAKEQVSDLERTYTDLRKTVEDFYAMELEKGRAVAVTDSERTTQARNEISLQEQRAKALIDLAEEEAKKKLDILSRTVDQTGESAKLEKKIYEDLQKAKIDSLRDWEKVVVETYTNALKEAKQHASKIKDLESEKKQVKLETEDAIREIQSRTWTEEQVYASDRKIADEAMQKARKALFSGAEDTERSFKETAEWIARAEEYYKKLAGTAQGDADAIRGLTELGKLKVQQIEKEIAIEREKEAAAKETARVQLEQLGAIREQISAMRELANVIKEMQGKVKEAAPDKMGQIDIDIAAAEEKIRKFNELKLLDKTAIMDAETADAVTKLEELRAKKEEAGAPTTAKVAADTTEAFNSIENLSGSLRDIEQTRIVASGEVQMHGVEEAKAQVQSIADQRAEIQATVKPPDPAQIQQAIEVPIEQAPTPEVTAAVVPDATQVDQKLSALDATTVTSQDVVDVDSREVDAKLRELEATVTHSTHVIHVQRVEENRWGGFIQRLAEGGWNRLSGKLSGWGGGDRVRALLEAGEFVVRKEAVQRYGAAFFDALNSMRVDLPRPSMAGVAHYAEGGAVSVEDAVTLRLQAGQTQLDAKVRGPNSRQRIREIEKELRKMGLVYA